tara:strand:+ start:50 stop:685 length:636 start_codon:yes stop_codon:yes gene_type:complete
MSSLNQHIEINKLLNVSKLIKSRYVKLPKVIIIFDDSFFNKKKFLNLKIPRNSAFLLRSYKSKERKKIAKQLLKFCKIRRLKLLISSDIKLADNINADGVHFPEYMVKKNNKINWKYTNQLKLKKKWITTVAAHNINTIKLAKNFNIDAALLSPVFPSKSHPMGKILGVKKFTKIVKQANLPIYALGGINIKNVKSLLETDIIGYAFQRGK